MSAQGSMDAETASLENTVSHPDLNAADGQDALEKKIPCPTISHRLPMH